MPFDKYRFGAMAIEHNDEEPKRTDLLKFLEGKGYTGSTPTSRTIFRAPLGRSLAWLEDVAIFAVPEIEFVADDRPVHRVGAVDQLAVDDGVGAEIVGQVGRAARIPAAAMSFFRVHVVIVAEIQCGMAMCGGPPSPSDKPITNKSGRTVKCVKFQKEMPGLDAAPWPGEIGQRIYENVSARPGSSGKSGRR